MGQTVEEKQQYLLELKQLLLLLDRVMRVLETMTQGLQRGTDGAERCTKIIAAWDQIARIMQSIQDATPAGALLPARVVRFKQPGTRNDQTGKTPNDEAEETSNGPNGETPDLAKNPVQQAKRVAARDLLNLSASRTQHVSEIRSDGLLEGFSTPEPRGLGARRFRPAAPTPDLRQKRKHTA